MKLLIPFLLFAVSLKAQKVDFIKYFNLNDTPLLRWFKPVRDELPVVRVDIKYDTVSCFLLVSDTSSHVSRNLIRYDTLTDTYKELKQLYISEKVWQMRGYQVWEYGEWEAGIEAYLDENKKPLPKWMAVWMKL